MTFAKTEDDIGALVQAGRVHKRVYTDPAIFAMEMERLWGQAWLYVGHVSQVKKPGDYFATTLAQQPVILVRHKDDSVHVLFNRCAHKGAQVVGDSCGHAQQLRCCYHGWVYDTDGSLLHRPGEAAYQQTGFDKHHPLARLQAVPRMEIYRGFVFASLAATGADLKTWLGPARSSFDNAVERSPQQEIEITGGVLRYVHDANWKILLENVSDNMHPVVTHQSAWQPAKQLAQTAAPHADTRALAMLEPFGATYDFFDDIMMTTCGNGHSYSGGSVSIHSAYPADSQYRQDMLAVYGEARANDILSVNRQNTIIYPSIAFKSSIQTIRVYRPLAVDKTIQETWTFKLKGAPAEMLHTAVLYNQLIFSPSSIAGHDDYEAYHRIQQGLALDAAEWVSQHRHINGNSPQQDGTTTAKGTSDIVFRHEFEAWSEYMQD